MRIRTLTGLAAAAAMTFVFAMPSSAQPPAPESQQQPPAQEEAASPTVEGDLVSVDADAKRITVKTADGEEVVIAYTDTTEVSGAQEGAAGLATMTDAKVTVHFTEDADTKAKTATRIIVQPKG